MALLKNLYIDLSFLNPFKKKKESDNKTSLDNTKKADLSKEPMPVSPADIRPVPKKVFRELPPAPKKLVEKQVTSQEFLVPKKLPKINAPPPIKEDKDQDLGNRDKTEIKKVTPPAPVFEKHHTKKKHLQEKPVEDYKLINKDVPLINDSNLKSSFFKDLYDHLSIEGEYLYNKIPSQVLQKNLFDEMQNFWSNKKYELNSIKFSKALRSKIVNKIQDLHNYEIEWQKMQLESERLKDELASKEILIENSINELKRIFKKAQVTMNLSPDHHFILANGTRIKNLEDFALNLSLMHDDVFYSHVNNEKNDFSTWIKEVFGLDELALELEKVKSKHKMVNLINNWHLNH